MIKRKAPWLDDEEAASIDARLARHGDVPWMVLGLLYQRYDVLPNLPALRAALDACDKVAGD